VPPAPARRRQPSTWRAFLRRHQDQLLARDFFTVETLFLKTVWVLFFIELGTRRVYLAGCTTTPDATWVTQQARHPSWQLQDGEVTVRYLLHDRDGKFTPGFDAVFRSEGVEVVHTPYRAPTANAIAERWVGSVRRECLDHLLIVPEAHLRQVLSTYVAHYNQARPHQGLDQRTPVPCDGRARDGAVGRRDLLGGLLREYYREGSIGACRGGMGYSHPTGLTAGVSWGYRTAKAGTRRPGVVGRSAAVSLRSDRADGPHA
jgi:putative transposase